MATRDFNIAAILDGQLAKVSDSDTPVKMIPLADIHPNPRNFYPRVENLEDLEASIQANGLLEPLTVVPDEAGGYRLISGHNRFAALRKIHSEKYQDGVPCLVLPAMDEHVELSAIIESNRQRVKTPALLAEEAEKLTHAYTARKRAGENLPGRIRDHVAEAMQISKTKLANLSAIKNGLKNQRFIDLWQRNAMTEACALEIARMDRSTQDNLSEWLEREDEECLLRTVREFNVISFKIDHDCELAGAPCPNARNMYAAFCRGGNWEDCCGCCDTCLRKDTCDNCCAFVEHAEPSSSHEPEPGGMGIAPPPKLENRVELSADDWQVRRERFSNRLQAARESTGLDRAAFAEKIGEYKATYSAWENGNLPGSSAFPRLAQALGVSTDYLYGLTDDPTPKPAPAQWQLLDEAHWPEDQQLVILRWDNGLGESCYATARCVGGYHDTYPFEDTDVGCHLEEPSHEEYDIAFWWMPLPIQEEEEHG